MTSLVRASLENTTFGYTKSGQNTGGLTENEIYGNIFLFNFAGHDTTPHTLAFAIVFLAAKPLVQDWVSEELRHVLGDRNIKDWNYAADFPQLKRCMAVMLGTLRLYTPVPIAKSTGKEARVLDIGDKHITVPANTLVISNHTALHTHPRYWGNDNLEWRPSRWIETKEPKDPWKMSSSSRQRRVPSLLGLRVYVSVLARSFPRWNLWQLWQSCFVTGELSLSLRKGRIV